MDDIARAFDPNANPDVSSGGRSDQDVFMEFMNLWDTQVKDGIVSEAEFCDYHFEISSLIDSDDDFATYMKGSFNT